MNKYKVIIKKGWIETEFVFLQASRAANFMVAVVENYHKKDDKDDDIEVLLKIDKAKEEEQEEETNEPISD